MLMFTIFTNIAISSLMLLINARFSLVILLEMVAIIDQKSGGKVLKNNLSYIFLTKMGLLLLAILASGASPFLNIMLFILNCIEYKYIMLNFKPKKIFIIF
jgi:hypothetical protein